MLERVVSQGCYLVQWVKGMEAEVNENGTRGLGCLGM